MKYIDLETGGFDPLTCDVLEIGVVDDGGQVLLNTLIRPVKQTEWPKAQEVNKIAPDMVLDNPNLPTLVDIVPHLVTILGGDDIVAYNAPFDCSFLQPYGILLDRRAHCAMAAWSGYKGVWDSGRGCLKRHKQVDAAAEIGFKWNEHGDAHRACADAQACRAIWKHIEHHAQNKH